MNNIMELMPNVETKPVTHEDLMNEYDFITMERFMKTMLTGGIITVGEFDKIMQKVRDKFSPLYPEIRAN